MCGILCVLYCSSSESQVQLAKKVHTKVIKSLQEQLKRRGHDSVQHVQLHVPFSDMILVMIGCVLSLRGLITPQPVNDGQSWLLWNGEVFDGLAVGPEENDTSVVLRNLSGCHGDHVKTLHVLDLIKGPWATIYWEELTSTLWMGRDVLGRRSLVWHLPQNSDDIFVISSIGNGNEFHQGFWSEVPALGVYEHKVKNEKREETLVCHLWEEKETGDLYIPSAREQLQTLCTSSILNIQSSLPSINVSFRPLNTTILPPSSLQSDWSINAEKLLRLLEDSVRRRLICTSEGVVKMCEGKVGLLFSGGLDSTVLAAITDRCLDDSQPIDLINVAFNISKDPSIDNFDVPDRITALQSLQELNPARQWNLILVNVLYEEVTEMKKSHIIDCIHPLNTVLDDSLGCAIWFAARGQGILYSSQQPYQSTAKILLVGAGADEQLAGYSRHRTQYRLHGLEGLISEIHKDIKRLSTRNLGRDDRCIADHHREGRFPYLDEEVIDFLNSLPIQYKSDLELPRGQGEKRLLREVALLLGCRTAAGLPKRALQFGSKSAGLGGGGGKTKGSDISDELIIT